MFFWKPIKRGTVLIVDDDPGILLTLRDRLEMNDFAVLMASNGLEGLRMALADKPDVVITDVCMPIMGGFKMIEALRQHSEFGRIVPVIMTSAKENPNDLCHALELHVHSFLIKPFEMAEFLGILEEVIRPHAMV